MFNTDKVEHQTSQRCFLIEKPLGTAVLKYYLDEDNQAVNFYSTFVPDTLRNQGLAEKLVRAGLSWAKQQHYQISADCSYVKRFL